MKTITHLLLLFLAVSTYAVEVPNLVVRTNSQTQLHEYADGYRLTAYSNDSSASIDKYRMPNLIASYTANYFVSDNGDTINTAYNIRLAFETAEYVLVISDSAALRWYAKPSFNITRTIPGEPGSESDTIRGLSMTISDGDTIMALTSDEYITVIGLQNGYLGEIEVLNFNVEEVWFSRDSRDNLNITEPIFPSMFNGPDTLHSIGQVWTGIFYREQTWGEYIGIADAKYLTSMDWYFNENVLVQNGITPPPIMAYNLQYKELLQSIGFMAHFDNGYNISTGYTWSLDEAGMRIHSVGVAIGSNPSLYDAAAINAFQESGIWHGYRTIGNIAEKLDLTSMEPIGEVPSYSGRQVQLCGPQNLYAFASDGFFTFSQKDSIKYLHKLPRILRHNGTIISATNENNRCISPDGGNCAWDGNAMGWADIAHENAGDYHHISGLAVESWRNARLDTLINANEESYNMGLIFYQVDTNTGQMSYLDEFTKRFNYVVNPVAQHDVNFVEGIGNEIILSFWNNHQNTCDTLMGEFVVVKIWGIGNGFDFSVLHREQIGISDALGSNKIKILGLDTLGIANTGTTHPEQSLFENNFQIALYNISASFNTYNIIATMLGRDAQENPTAAYQVDFLPASALPSPEFEVSLSFSEDSSTVFLKAEKHPLGTWYWNASTIYVDSILSLSISKIQLEEEKSYLYISGKYPLDITRTKWENRVLSYRYNLTDTIQKIMSRKDTSISAIKYSATPQISIYPIPAKEYLFIKNFKTNQAYIIYDITGKPVKEGLLEKQLNISELTAGLYILRTLEDQVKIVVH